MERRSLPPSREVEQGRNPQRPGPHRGLRQRQERGRVLGPGDECRTYRLASPEREMAFSQHRGQGVAAGAGHRAAVRRRWRGTVRPSAPCATLREAITAASSGDTVEIRSDGPFLVPPAVVRGKALTIRAAAGRRPVLRLRGGRVGAGRWFLLESDAPLVLEGLELQRRRPAVRVGASRRRVHFRGSAAVPGELPARWWPDLVTHTSWKCITPGQANSATANSSSAVRRTRGRVYLVCAGV